MDFWKIENAVNEKRADIYIYGYISQAQVFADDITPKRFANELNALGDIEELHIHINSNGGVVFAAFAIYNILKAHPARKIVHVEGIAASAASVIMMAGDEIAVNTSAMIMIHNPSVTAEGESDDLRKSADVLDKLKENIIDIYVQRTGLEREDVSEMMDNETWLTAEEAVSLGFADRIEGVPVNVTITDNALNINGVSYDISSFRSLPSALLLNAVSVNDNEETVRQECGQEQEEEVSVMQDEQKALTEAVNSVDVDSIRADLAAEIEAKERERVSAILAIDAPDCDDIKNDAIKNGLNYEQACAAILASGRLQEICRKSKEMMARVSDAKDVADILTEPAIDINELDDASIVAKMEDKDWWKSNYPSILARYKMTKEGK